MTARKRAMTEAELRQPRTDEDHYERTTPGPIGASHRATFLQADADGYICGSVITRGRLESDGDDVRQTDMKRIYGDLKAGRTPGITHKEEQP